MMEPVAWVRECDLKEMSGSDGIEMDVLPQSADGADVALVRLSDAEARIAELQSQVDNHANWTASMQHGLDRGKELLAAAEARAEAAEALLKEAGDIIETFAQIGDYVLAEAPAEATMWYAGPSCTGEHMAQVSLDYFRAARSLASKIGVKDE